jgi:hypothetical protein
LGRAGAVSRPAQPVLPNWCMGFRRDATIPGRRNRGLNWCMGFWLPRATCVPPLAAASGPRRSKQGLAQMQADGRGGTRMGQGRPHRRGSPGLAMRCLPCGTMPASGLSACISVHLCCICVESFLRCRVPHCGRRGEARCGVGAWQRASRRTGSRCAESAQADRAARVGSRTAAW